MVSPLARRALTSLLAVSGTAHFAEPEPFNHVVPPWLPGKRSTWTYAFGAAELATASLLACPDNRVRKGGGLAAAVLLCAEWPANFEAVRHRLDSPWPNQIPGLIRLPLQLPLIKTAWDIGREASAK